MEEWVEGSLVGPPPERILYAGNDHRAAELTMFWGIAGNLIMEHPAEDEEDLPAWLSQRGVTALMQNE